MTNTEIVGRCYLCPDSCLGKESRPRNQAPQTEDDPTQEKYCPVHAIGEEATPTLQDYQIACLAHYLQIQAKVVEKLVRLRNLGQSFDFYNLFSCRIYCVSLY